MSGRQHGPSIVLNTVEPTFAFALSVAGAGLFETHSSFFDEMSRIKREFAAEHLGSAKLGQDELLASVQVRFVPLSRLADGRCVVDMFDNPTDASALPAARSLLKIDRR